MNNNSSGNGNNSNRDRDNFESQDMVFAATSDAEKFDDDIWICDSGASSHYCVSDKGMFDVRDIDEKIRVGNGNLLVATQSGNLNLDATQIDGTKFTITLQDVKFVPDLWVNLLSINQALKKGYRISNNIMIISLSKGLNKITFDRFFKAKDGTVSGILMRPCDNPIAYTVLNGVTKRGIEINDFHTMLGHCGSACCLHAFSNAKFSPASSNLKNLTVSFKFFNSSSSPISVVFKLLLRFRKQLQQ
jgi:hypothetical protein